ncbi:hypothetical protein [Novosphingobium sp.]|uniref:hypothetical protein n=1 Tax=Novosphingobium sp. TaxID=1874826 RepID=UPI0038B86B3B
MSTSTADAPLNGHLNGHQRKILASIMQHPASHNLEWHDVLSLLPHLGSLTERHGGGYDFAIDTDHITLGKSHDKDVGADDLRGLRALLTRAKVAPAGPVEPAEATCIVLIDHQQARLFANGDSDGNPTVIKPEDADGSRRRIEHKQGNDDHDGGHAAEEDHYYERIAIALQSAQRIVVFSDGKGRSNAGAYLVDYLERHHPGVAGHIVATERIDIAHTSDGETVATGLALLAAG